MFPKKGNKFPNTHGRVRSRVQCAAAIGDALRSELDGTHRSVKTLMRWTQANERTVKNWLAGRRCPRCEHLIEVIRHSDAVYSLILQLAGRDASFRTSSLATVRSHLEAALEQIDRNLAEGDSQGS